MQDSTTFKEKVLKKIREALIHETPQPFPQVEGGGDIYARTEDPLDIQFVEEFTKAQGIFVFCENHIELASNLSALAEGKKWEHMACWDNDLLEALQNNGVSNCSGDKNLDKADAGITTCEALVARTGSVMLSSRQASGRTLSIFPPAHVVVAYTNQFVYDIVDALKRINEKYGDNIPSMINFMTGPSRTADIEKTLVLGAHGPKEVYLFLIDEGK